MFKFVLATLFMAPGFSFGGTDGGGIDEVFLRKMSFSSESISKETPKLLFVGENGDSVVYLLDGEVISQSIEILEAVEPELLGILEEQFDRGISASGVTTSI